MRQNLIFNISPPKCGTTALFHCLARCESIAKPRIKEPRFFGLPHQGDAVPESLRLDGKYDLGMEWFYDLFKPTPSSEFLLDFSTYYSVIPDTANLIKEHFPNATLIFLVREPSKRFVSHYYEFAKASIAVPTISEAIEGTSDFGKLMYEFADYSKTYQRFAEQFGEDQICTIKFENLKSAPEKVGEHVSNFLNIQDFEFSPSAREKNVSGRAKSELVQTVLRGKVTKSIAQMIPSFAYSRLLAIRKKMVLWNTKSVANPELSESDSNLLRQQLASAYEFHDSLH